MFTITARHRGRPVELRWENGKLTGDKAAVAEVLDQAKWRSVGVGAGPVWSGPPTLAEALPAYLLLIEALDDVKVTGGKAPSIPQVPPGAIP
jgi:hypothetical protein